MGTEPKMSTEQMGKFTQKSPCLSAELPEQWHCGDKDVPSFLGTSISASPAGVAVSTSLPSPPSMLRAIRKSLQRGGGQR